MTALCTLLCELRAQNITAIISTGILAEQRQCWTKILWTNLAKSLIPPQNGHQVYDRTGTNMPVLVLALA